jgi:hypothetical protein
MNPNVLVRQLMHHPELRALLEARGVLLDEWDQRLTLAELCQEYAMDLRELLRVLRAPLRGPPE